MWLLMGFGHRVRKVGQVAPHTRRPQGRRGALSAGFGAGGSGAPQPRAVLRRSGMGMARLIVGAVSGHAADRMGNERVTSQERKVRNVSNKVRKKENPLLDLGQKMAKHRK